jgi:hypothetical protein
LCFTLAKEPTLLCALNSTFWFSICNTQRPAVGGAERLIQIVSNVTGFFYVAEIDPSRQADALPCRYVDVKLHSPTDNFS